jgi:hypothetical protein
MRKFSSLNEPMLKSFNKLIVLTIYGIKSSGKETLIMIHSTCLLFLPLTVIVAIIIML